MKFLNLTFLALLITQFSFSQAISSLNPPKKTWKILIKNNKSAEENFYIIGNTIIDNDFLIEKKDKDFFLIQTSPRTLKKLNAYYYLNFIAKDNLIILTGMSKTNLSLIIGGNTSESSYDKIINKGMRGSVSKESFNEMFRIATLFPKSEYEFITD